MASGKYGKYIIEEPKPDIFLDVVQPPSLALNGPKYWENLAFSIAFLPIAAPWYMEKGTMKHDFDQMLIFMGGDSNNIFDFQAEIELGLGDEGEKHIITKASTIYIPKGLGHCPLNFKVVKKPVIFVDISFTKEYSRNKKVGNDWKSLKGKEIMKDYLEDQAKK